MATCPACWSLLASPTRPAKGSVWFDCPRCGEIILTDEVVEDLPVITKGRPVDIAKLSHSFRQIYEHSPGTIITKHLALSLLEAGDLPSPQGQLENLILYLGEQQGRPGVSLEMTAAQVSWIGSVDFEDFVFIVQSGIDLGLVSANIRRGFTAPLSIQDARLTCQI